MSRKNKPRKKWTPLVRCSSRTKATGEAADLVNAFNASDGGADEVWGNSRYTVHVRRQGKMVHLSIHNRERTAAHDWRDYQRIKNEIIGPEEEAVELYPAESRLVDTSNEFHLFCVLGVHWPFGYSERLVSERGDDVGAVQRPWEDDEGRPKDLKYISLDDIRNFIKPEKT